MQAAAAATTRVESQPGPGGATKTFLLGVGCQKGGTTWLYDYLTKIEGVALGPLKEYHIFDMTDLSIGAKKLRKLERKDARVRAGRKDSKESVTLRMHLLADEQNYYRYFNDLLQGDGLRLTADITPAYAALSAERFTTIREQFEARGITVKVVFLMRDPVERVWSSVRMMLRDQAEKRPDARVLERDQEELVLERHETDNQRARTNYHLTVAALEQAFAPENIFYGFYETLFREETIRDLSSFLGLPYGEPEFSQRQNESPKSEAISEAAARHVASSYAPVYAFARERFGAEFIDRIWPSSAYVPAEKP